MVAMIYVRSARSDNRVAFYERDRAHPESEAYVAADYPEHPVSGLDIDAGDRARPVLVAETDGVLEAIADNRIARCDAPAEPDPAIAAAVAAAQAPDSIISLSDLIRDELRRLIAEDPDAIRAMLPEAPPAEPPAPAAAPAPPNEPAPPTLPAEEDPPAARRPGRAG